MAIIPDSKNWIWVLEQRRIVESLARYYVHDPIHLLLDVRR